MKDDSPKNKLISKIASVSNILITVSRNPSIDQLASALGLAIAINKMGKRAVAVFSGNIPRSINFLHPERTFEDNADSLRDFIISLSKDKADRLQCKPEGDFVKVYITPYKTKITPQDLKFEEGDFNIELILAIGVGNREDLDAAVASHGKIFHNAIVGTINCGMSKDVLGTISWRDEAATCYSEMCSSLIDGLSTADKQLMDDAVSTALLTGVVAATNQFRNTRTTPAIMTLAANLMAHGANQQLITSELSDSTDEAVKIEDMKPTPMLENSLDIHNDDEIKPPAAPLVSPINAKVVDEAIDRDRNNLGSSRSEEAVDAAEEQLTRIKPVAPVLPPAMPVPTDNDEVNSSLASPQDVSGNVSPIQPLGRDVPSGAPLNIPAPDKPSLPPVLPPMPNNNNVNMNNMNANPMAGVPSNGDAMSSSMPNGGSVNRPAMQPLPPRPSFEMPLDNIKPQPSAPIKNQTSPVFNNGVLPPLQEKMPSVGSDLPPLPPLQPANSASSTGPTNGLPISANQGMPLPPPPPLPNFGAGNSELPPIPPLPNNGASNNGNGSAPLPPLPPLQPNAEPNSSMSAQSTDFSAVPPTGSFGQPNNTISTSSNSSLPPIPPISTDMNPVAPPAPEPTAPTVHDPTQFVLPS